MDGRTDGWTEDEKGGGIGKTEDGYGETTDRG